MQCTPFLASKEADLCENWDNLLDFDDKLWVISLLLEIFRRLKDISIGFYTPNSMHAVFRVETSPTLRNMRTYTRSCRKRSVISLVLEIFRRSNATSIAFYTSNAMHAVFGAERSRPVRKMRSFIRFWRNLNLISLLLEILRRLYAISISFYTPSAMHAVLSVETRPSVC